MKIVFLYMKREIFYVPKISLFPNLFYAVQTILIIVLILGTVTLYQTMILMQYPFENYRAENLIE